MPRSRRGPPKGANSSVAGAAPRGGRVSGLNQAYNRMAKASRVPNPLATPTTHQGELPGRRVEVKELNRKLVWFAFSHSRGSYSLHSSEVQQPAEQLGHQVAGDGVDLPVAAQEQAPVMGQEGHVPAAPVHAPESDPPAA
ncbi:hypothetical protein OsJ_15340 [Oryza sativa Japonica Group]|uniref:Uncharacterized protein n=1 Tax=Oryza sativa subsp. japonica TaxID=39947 RepID=B9FFY1_ORYSJ|nr:hypothetical protein OsJ_15340 [Oryza sativa Japonica Group]